MVQQLEQHTGDLDLLQDVYIEQAMLANETIVELEHGLALANEVVNSLAYDANDAYQYIDEFEDLIMEHSELAGYVEMLESEVEFSNYQIMQFNSIVTQLFSTVDFQFEILVYEAQAIWYALATHYDHMVVSYFEAVNESASEHDEEIFLDYLEMHYD